ncbi:MAG: EVE domain-containing protein [Kiritimatiellia bacterium]
MQYWLMKSEPSVFSIDDLVRDGVTGWEGVRNYQARNFMRDAMRVGDLALFYHSNATPPGVVGVMRVVREGYPDDTAADKTSPYFDAKAAAAGKSNPWVRVDLELVEKFPVAVRLEQLRAEPALAGLMVTRKGSRLSVQPVEQNHFVHICHMGQAQHRY